MTVYVVTSMSGGLAAPGPPLVIRLNNMRRSGPIYEHPRRRIRVHACTYVVVCAYPRVWDLAYCSVWADSGPVDGA